MKLLELTEDNFTSDGNCSKTRWHPSRGGRLANTVKFNLGIGDSKGIACTVGVRRLGHNCLAPGGTEVGRTSRTLRNPGRGTFGVLSHERSPGKQKVMGVLSPSSPQGL